MALLELLPSWLLAYLLHSTMLLALAWGAERRGLLRAPALAQTVWRWALFGGLLTATVQLAATQIPSLPVAVSAAMPAQTSLSVPIAAAAAMPPAPAAPAAHEPRTEAREPVAPLLAAGATLVWIAGATLGALLLAVQLCWLARIVARLPRYQDPTLERFGASLCARAGLAMPRLRRCARWSSPLVAPRLAPPGDVCLPPWVAELSAAQREVVLAHELAHLLRRDPAWRVAARLVARIGWMQPLNRLALRRLDALAELACDAWAAHQTDGAHALAESLYAGARHARAAGRRHAGPVFAAAMTDSNSPLLQRMQQLMEEPSMTEQKPTSRRTRWLIGGGLVLTALLVPALMIEPAHGSMSFGLPSFGTLLHADGQRLRIESNDLDGKLKIRLNGRITYTEAEDDVQSLKGRLEIEHSRLGKTRHLLIASDDTGALKRSYEVDGKAVATPGEDDRRWLAEMVTALIDASANHDERVRRLHARGGIEAVLADLAKARTEHGRRGRIEAIMGRLAPLDAAVLERVLAAAGQLSGDFERRNALQAVISKQPLSAGQQLAVLKLVEGIGSDFERGQALAPLAAKLAADAPVLQAWLAALAGMGSDFETRIAIEQLMQNGQLSPAHVGAALQATRRLGSDFEHRVALEAIAPRMAGDAELLQVYTQSAGAIGGGFDRRMALVSLLDRSKTVDKSVASAILDGATGLDGFELTTVLQAVAAKMPADAELIARYRKLARGLGDFERGQVEKAIDHLA